MKANYLTAMAAAKEKAGWRERYAMRHGKAEEVTIGGHPCLRFTYSPDEEYQDANGATFCIDRREWIN